MGRIERPLDPEAGTVERFAFDLRQLRQRAGTPPYRTLARRTHYSVTSLSQAASGRALPSLAVTQAFVLACGGDPDEWQQRWHEAARTARPEEPKDAEESESEEPEPPRRRRRPTAVAVAVIVAAVILAAGGVVTAVVLSDRTPPRIAALAATQRQPGAADPVADGSDPGRAGCGPDAVTMASVRVHFPVDQLSGQIELRYSPHCHAAWGRFEPVAGWYPGPGTVVTVLTIRPADQATQQYSVEFGRETIIGNMLMTARGCVAAEVTMVRGQVRSPMATTACVPIS